MDVTHLRKHVVPGRLTAALVGLLGLLLALPALWLPTHAILQKPPEPAAPDASPFRLSVWSWGRVAATATDVDATIDVGNTAGLVILAAALAAGLAGVAAFALRRGPDGRVLGAAGLAWAAAQVVGGLGRRTGDTISQLFGDGDQLTVETSAVGWLELVAAVLLVGSLGLVLLRPVVAAVRPAVTRARALASRAATRDEAADAAADGVGPPVPRVGIATIRDVPEGPYRQGTARGEHAGKCVGFSDEPVADPDRFRPPR